MYDSINSVYYYSAAGNNHGIYSYNTESNEIIKMCDDEAQYLNLVLDRLFYVNVSDGYKIYSIGIDGSDRQLVVDVDSDYLTYYDKHLYYRNNNDNGYLYMTSIDDMVSELIYDNRITYINVTEDYIGFINEQVGYDVYVLWHDGQYVNRVTTDGDISILYCTEEKIYYGNGAMTNWLDPYTGD